MTTAAIIVPVVLCGGTGTRLWPLSRRALPKQFLAMDGEATMLQETAARLSNPALEPTWYVCSDEHRFMIAEQLRRTGLPMGKILLEPAARGTAPAAAIAALACLAQYDGADNDPLLLVAPADHVVRDAGTLLNTILAAADAARAGHMVVFGIEPDAPETGYGYIKAGAALAHQSAGAAATARHVDRFVEKPDRARAEAFLAEGSYYWNSGIFLFSARRFLAELEQHRPDILAACTAAAQNLLTDADFVRVDAGAFAACPSDAIDTAVMERTSKATVLLLSAGWSDVGTWSALWDIGSRDDDDNVTRGNVHAIDCTRSYLRSEGPLIAALGVSDLLVVATDDAVLVAPRDRAQDLRQVVDRLKQAQCEEVEQSATVYRPWGYFRRIDAGARFQVKHIMVNPGASLSLQMHHHRAEHWVVVSGTARVVRGDDTFLLSENQSTYIPIGVTHRLENPGRLPLSLIEIQSGSYLGEDDIVRFQDTFGRV
ncbi:mannose-1-phosphate guanylyltransferase/mannose-6-phosphate isomerase [Ferrovibrio sp. MS7]|uniref:mannose-1-phosphate guanylyltransferase/mannose-6-phosphate isomerase n=1 Tax=Ferrovibrio plantarum TaxID=3119164 RepID=UPI00313495FB